MGRRLIVKRSETECAVAAVRRDLRVRVGARPVAARQLEQALCAITGRELHARRHAFFL